MPGRATSFASLVALVATPLALGLSAPASAVPSTGLVITEVFGGNSATNLYNQDFVEIYNPTSAAISLDGKSVQYRSATGTAAPSGVTALTGSVPAGSYFLIGMAATAGGTSLPVTPDATSSINLSGTTGTVILANKATALTATELPAGDVATNGATNVIDLLGYGGSNTFEGAVRAGAPTNTATAIRTQNDTDNNANDFTGSSSALPPSPTNKAASSTPLAATDPGDRTLYVTKAMAPIALQATGGTAPYSWTASGTPDGISVSAAGVVSGTPTTLGTSTVTATVTDSASATATTQFDLVVSEIPVRPLKTIPEIQGEGATSPLDGQDVAVTGAVTARYPDGGINGFVIQTPGYDPEDDATPQASDAVFVYAGGTVGYTLPAIGDVVTIASGRVSEFNGATQVTVTNGDFVTSQPATAEQAVTPGTVVPGTDCAQGSCPSGAELDALREAHEFESFLPSGTHTVTDSYSGGVGSSSMRGEFEVAMRSDEPLYIALDRVRPTETAQIAAINAFNDAHGVVLDDGATVTYTATTAYPWLTLTNTVRGGAHATFVKPVVLDYRFNSWRLQPSSRIQPGNDGSGQVAFEQDRPAAPDDVLGAQGNLKIATFNMLNYFVHPVDQWVATGGDAYPGTNRTCTTYKDRNGVPLTANTCTWRDPRTQPPGALPDIGPRGAATSESLSRQQVKEVAAINTMNADVMSLEEVENPVKLGYSDRDAALKVLVAALNADWDATHPGQDPQTLGKRWAYVPTPRAEAQPTIQEQDAIRSAFIYNPRVVETVGRSEILVNSPPFRNAREPLAQGFKHVGGTHDDAFLVIVNHFKSKGGPDDPSTIAGTDNEDTGNGAGSYNGDRIRQARALDAFADALVEDKGIASVFMTGDYNSYSQEDPITTLEGLGWNPLDADNGETSYFYGGLAGSLDHVFANDAALGLVEGATIWPINANEPIYYEYSRYNYNVTPLYDQTAFRSSDHNPEIIGITAPVSAAPPAVDTVQVLASNDFHGRLLDDPGSASAGAAAMAGAVKGLRAENPDTTFVMAGDIVGASTFESFIQDDKPTIDAMNEAGLEVSAAGNHEFDQGYDDLMDRIMSADDPEGGADWPYLAANVRDADGDYALGSERTDGNFAHANGATWWKSFDDLDGGAGIRVGFVGAVTEDLPSLVSPDAIRGLAITSVVEEVNAAAADLKEDGCGGQPCDLVVELVHEGAPSPSCATIGSDTDSTFGRIVHETSDDVDAIISGHTHLKYNCKVPVAGKALERPVVSAGQYGSYLNQLQFDFEPGTDTLVGIRQHVLAMKDYDEDAATKAVVDAAVVVANDKGSVELGRVEAPFKRARRVDPASGVVENRGGESTLGNLVAEMQREETGADIGVMNPGGLRDDLVGTADGPGPVTYREAANVQPFANTLVTVDLTGAQLKLLLEQQWQRDPDGNIPSRPFLRLGTSKGFTWTEDATRSEGNRITGMWLDGAAVDPTATYTVSANSFIASGGDNFRALTLGTGRQDTGKTDLQATVDYLAAHASSEPLAVDYAQHGVGARAPAGPFAPGDTVTVPVDSLSMTGGGTSADITDEVDTQVTVSLGGADLGTAPVTSTLPTTPYDVPGAATVSFTLPAGLPAGTQWFTLTGATTGTVAHLPVTVAAATSTVTGTADPITWGQAGSVAVTVTPGTATGTVELYDGATRVGQGTVVGGTGTITVGARTLGVGSHTLTLQYLGDAAHAASTGTVTVQVVPATSTTTATATPASVVQDSGTSSIAVAVTGTGVVPTGQVSAWLDGAQLATATLVDGQATLAVGPFAAVGSKAVEVRYAGSTDVTASSSTVSITVTAKPVPQPTATTVTGTDTSVQWARAGAVAVSVAPSAATGTVELYDGATRIGTATVAGGSARVALAPRSLEVGRHVLVVKYLGSASYAPSQGTVTVTVTKAKPKVKVERPDRIDAGDKARIAVDVVGDGYRATGKVEIVLEQGKREITVRTSLDGGSAVARVAVGKPGTWKVTVTYLGDEHTLRGEDTTTLKVRR
ncbi:ExeM/NucH family extracellular endonuclease [Nocardioides zeicaulis]|uniref:ExeM/NucH family extracellular endonuclease n=1 Tax=Nocardioides zeicaulis TaxID=1776857 RepID=A0ABV6E3F7_9ACTN